MAVPRPLLLALIGVVLLAATFMATRSSREQASSSSADAVPTAPAPNKTDAAAAKPAKPAAAKPESKPATKTEAKAAAKPKAQAASKPRSSSLSQVEQVERALDRKRIVVLAFFQPGADDRATESAVKALSRRQAAVFSERLSRIGRYRDLIGSLGISQAPAVVIIDPKRRARVVEGYVDAETLAQEVADARG
jgi:hypothetical protein